MSDLCVIDWIQCNDTAESMPDVIGGLGGWFGMWRENTWQDYLDQWSASAQHHCEALRSEILRRQLRRGGFWHQSETECGVPVFSDGSVACFSMRAWGDLLAAVWSEADGVPYCYVDFAWEE